MKRKYKIKFSLYYIGAWQFHVELPSLTSVIYGKKSQISIFRSTQKKSMWHSFFLSDFFFILKVILCSICYNQWHLAHIAYNYIFFRFSYFAMRCRDNISEWYTLPFCGKTRLFLHEIKILGPRGEIVKKQFFFLKNFKHFKLIKTFFKQF